MNSTTQKFGKYIFIDGILQPQIISKGVLAYFYDCTPTTFRSQLQKKGITDTSDRTKTYTKAETELIFAEFGPVYFEYATESYKKYLISRQVRQKYNRKRQKSRKNISNSLRFSI